MSDPVELLERAVSYTRGALQSAGVCLSAPTPCSQWTLGRLLEHMSDALDAFIEASAGVVEVHPGPGRRDIPARSVGAHVEALQCKACDLLSAWSAAGTGCVRLAGTRIDPRLLLQAAALEIAVHGHDVAGTGPRGPALPGPLARDLLPVARMLVTPGDRGVRFGPPVPPATPAPSAVLLGFLGRTE
ncbi:maleylpyruvate isomerase N-terminal domain-containing protein [Tomitella cavernea]|uniref:Mycothiol-dependent maleylpyruvate isomerase metal-binding domain-containing protein n=1 Tax=Tomitella cavernea TaxID=1387982 RepID=A0ABP9C410_9ACTN|nr:maleylpyruvate isomerase N-terminal domain-containing protein [Tomitella cavernea]